MKISITARHFTPSSELKELIEEKLMKLLVYDSSLSVCKVVLLKVDRAEKVELMLRSGKKQYISKCYSSSFEKTVNKAIDNIRSQIQKTPQNRSNRFIDLEEE